MAWRGLEVLGLLAGGPKSTRDIAEALGVNYDTARDICKRLVGRGLMLTVEGLHGINAAGSKAVEGGEEVVSGPGKGGCAERYKNSMRAKTWRALRIRRKVSVEALLPLVLGQDASPVDEANARTSLDRYLTALTKSGHLVELPSRGAQPRWVLTNDTGPCAPAWNKAQRTVTDANTGEVHHV